MRGRIALPKHFVRKFMRCVLSCFPKALECVHVLASLLIPGLGERSAQDNKRLQLVIEGRRYFELVLRVVVEMRSSPVSFGAPMASTSLPV
jgi:hypothetical protein